MNKEIRICDIVRKSIGASFCLSLAVPFLITNKFLGAILFSLGLLTICKLRLNLFTGLIGFVLEKKQNPLHIFIILVSNVFGGYLIGLLISLILDKYVSLALLNISNWDVSISFALKAFMCGAIMYIAVKLFKEGSVLGILIGVPLFILSAYQHCIVNAIMLGIGRTFNLCILISILGNAFGSLLCWFLTKTSLELKNDSECLEEKNR